jgi:subtilase family serine protease
MGVRSCIACLLWTVAAQSIIVQHPAGLPKFSAATPRAAASQPVSFAVGIAESGTDSVASCARDVSNPASPNYRQYWSAARIKATTATADSTAAQVTGWLTGAGLRVHSTAASGWLLVSGSVAAVEDAFQTELAVAAQSGQHFHRTPLHAPEDVAPHIQVPHGLASFRI